MRVSNWAIENRTTIFVLAMMIILAGVFSYATLPRETFPDVTIPTVLVNTIYEGASPSDVETLVTMKLEEKLSGLKDLKEMTSVSSEGSSMIMLEFFPDVVIEDALQYVRDRVDQAKPDLPDSIDLKEPVISEINVAEFPILMVSVSGDLSPVRLKAIADRLEEQFEKKIPGVLEADVLGAMEREIRIEIDPDRLVAYRLRLDEVLQLIPSANVNISAGGIETGKTKVVIWVPAEFDRPDNIRSLPLAVRDGRTIYLTDVATLRDTFRDRETYARLNGKPTITVTLKKRIGENVVDIIDQAKVIIGEFEARAPAGVTFEITLDQSDQIDMMISDLENNIFSGLVLVVLVLVLFMGFRTSVIVALAIPMSMLLSFVILQLLGHTLNMMILFGLIMALGMLVDNAIVIVENIYRHIQMGSGRVQAAMAGTAEVAWPVITSTATTLAAFAPLIFWPGMMGEFMKFLPITLVVTLTSSLFVAMVINPVICAVFAPGAKRKLNPNKHHPFVGAYRWLLGKALAHRRVTLLSAAAALVGMFVVYGFLNSGSELFPQMDPKQGIINIRAPQGTSIYETDRLSREVEARIAPRMKDHELEFVVANIGAVGGQETMFGGVSGGPHVGNITLTFEDFEDRQKKSADAMQEMRGYLADIPGAEIKVEKPQEGPPTGAPVTVRIIGENFRQLEILSNQAKGMIADVPGIVNLRSDYESAKPELRFQVDRARAARLGLSPAVIGLFLKTYINGAEVGKYREYNEEYRIVMRLPEDRRTNIEDILRLYLPNRDGTPVPVSSLGTFTYAGGKGNISHVGDERVITLTADNAEGFLSEDVLGEVQQRLAHGRQQLRTADVTDWPALARAIAEAPEDSAAARLRDGMNAETRAAMTRLSTGKDASSADRDGLLAAINAAIADVNFYGEEDFAGMELTDDQRTAAGRWRYVRGLSVPAGMARALNRKALGPAVQAATAEPELLKLPQQYELRYAGEEEERQKATAFLSKALVIALFAIVMILVTQFNSFSVPLIITCTVLLSLVGVLAGLLICRMPFGVIMTGIGVISLAGIVVNNAIVLLDYTRQLQRRGMELVAAAIEAGATRLRPVLLTATTTILGLVPMAIGKSYDIHRFAIAWKSESSQWWASMAIAIIFGLTFATILTLVVVPALYVSLYRTARRMGFAGIEPAASATEEVRQELEILPQ